ncbi:T9SS type A sorting domain-containing protein [Alkalitalea saponilacus]|nr:T9SS type A sorting domain-containing protein [Alkalitalea saponilacus]
MKSLITVCLFILTINLSAQSVSEISREVDTWTTSIDGTDVYIGNLFDDALQKAIDEMGAGVINIRNSATLSRRIHLRENQTIDFHSHEIHSSGNLRGYHVNGVTIRNLHMTGSPTHSLLFHGCSDIHLHNIRLEFSGPAGGVRIDNDRYANLVVTRNLKVTGEVYIQNTRGHAFETYGIDGIEIEQIEAHHTAGCGLLLNESKNAVIGSVVGTYNNQSGGYATFRVANDNGPNIRVESLYSLHSGRGFFSVSRSGDCVIQHVDIANSTRQGIFLEDAHDTFVMSGTVVDGNPNVQLVRTRNCGVFVNGAVPPPSEVLLGDGVFFKDLILYETYNYEGWNIMSDLNEGDVVYGDRSFTFASIPETLHGAEWIQTANNSRDLTFPYTYAEFEVVKSGYVYVAHSDRVSDKPEWLLDYDLTNLSVVVQENEATQRTFSVYRRKIEVGEFINLGINSNNGTTNSLMYFVIFNEDEHGGIQKVELGDGEFFENLVVFEALNGENWSIMSDLDEGQVVFGDRAFTFASIPTGLVGREWIQTAMNSRVYTHLDAYAEFKMKKNGVLYIAHADRVQTKPAWLSDYTETDMSIVVQENATTQRFLTLYEKEVSEGDVIKTGINSNNGTTQTLMYFMIFSDDRVTSINEVNSFNSDLKIYPNPFRTSTSVLFDLQKGTDVDIKLHALNGVFIETIFSGFKPAGNHSVLLQTAKLPSGVYIVSLRSDENQVEYRKAIVK